MVTCSGVSKVVLTWSGRATWGLHKGVPTRHKKPQLYQLGSIPIAYRLVQRFVERQDGGAGPAAAASPDPSSDPAGRPRARRHGAGGRALPASIVKKHGAVWKPMHETQQMPEPLHVAARTRRRPVLRLLRRES